ncbi:MAG: glyoxalase, partial [Hyphomonas sp.]|nr:glyoxalase [Hyphomonas sp.]
MIKGLDHVVLVCPDIASATAVYEALLGRPADWRASADGAATALFRLENTSLELMAPDGDG